MKAPGFWLRDGITARMLSPFSAITASLTARRLRGPSFSPGIKVICVGNAGVGGAGKTIVALDILHRLRGRTFALTRGYGGHVKGPLLVDTSLHGALNVGDEAMLLAAAAPTVVSRDRAAGARLALAEGASVVVMDDGLQNPALHKSLSILVIDGGYGFGNGRLLPAGPLREPVEQAASRVQAAVLIGPDETGALLALPRDLPVYRADLEPTCNRTLYSQPVIAFAGIGRPSKFFRSVEALGAEIVTTHEFPDHYIYSRGDAQRLLRQAENYKALLITTEKDFVKLPDFLRRNCLVVSVNLAWKDEGAWEALLHCPM